MAKDYTEEQIKVEFLNGEKNRRPYQYDCVKRNGPRSKSKKPYIETIAELILKEEEKGIWPYTENVKTDFCYSDERDDLEPARRSKEKGLCRRWFKNKSFNNDHVEDVIGLPAEFELNIEEKHKVNVDLISYKDETIYLIEVKGNGTGEYTSSESLLRAILEIKTYYESIKDKLHSIAHTCRDKHKLGLQNASKLRMAILVPENSAASRQFNNPRFPNVNKLLEKWKIEFLTFKEKVPK